jgi:hypothetical protein
MTHLGKFTSYTNKPKSLLKKTKNKFAATSWSSFFWHVPAYSDSSCFDKWGW